MKAEEFLDSKSTYGIRKEDGYYIAKDCVADMMEQYHQHKLKEFQKNVSGGEYIWNKGADYIDGLKPKQ